MWMWLVESSVGIRTKVVNRNIRIIFIFGRLKHRCAIDVKELKPMMKTSWKKFKISLYHNIIFLWSMDRCLNCLLPIVPYFKQIT